jgi:hypothetical protein
MIRNKHVTALFYDLRDFVCCENHSLLVTWLLRVCLFFCITQPIIVIAGSGFFGGLCTFYSFVCLLALIRKLYYYDVHYITCIIITHTTHTHTHTDT